MISVRNLPRLLSGNKLLLIGLLAIFTLSSCGSSKSVSKSRSTTSVKKKRTSTNKRRNKKVKVDTIQWAGSAMEKANSEVTTLPGSDGMIKKSVYNVSLFMPLNTQRAQGTDLTDKSTRTNGFINYYAGVKMALNQLEQEDVRLRVEVIDSENSTLPRKLRTAASSADVIIGPYSLDDIKSAAELGNKNDVTVVSPWKATTKIKNNPYYLQLLPTLYDHMDKIVEHAGNNFNAQDIILIGRKGNSKDKSILKYMQSANKRINGASSKALKEFFVETDSLLNGETAFDEIFNPSSTTAFIVPNYSSKDESYLRDCLRRLNVEKGLNKVVAYAMPLAYNSSQINFDFYKNLNMKIPRSYHVDLTDNRVQQFRRDFFNIYNATPTEDAYKGYDMMLFIGRALQEYGREFQFHIGKDDNNYLQTDFNISAKKEKGSEFDKVSYYTNQNLNMLEFSNNKFNRN